jgi:hypothetical protein
VIDEKSCINFEVYRTENNVRHKVVGTLNLFLSDLDIDLTIDKWFFFLIFYQKVFFKLIKIKKKNLKNTNFFFFFFF